MDVDTELLRRFADNDAQEAFAELVQRKIALVYAAALRQTGGDAHLAQDVTQAVFLALAARAHALRRHAALAAWLFTTTRFLAHKIMRTQRRWQQREKEANAMNVHSRDADPAWEQLRPAIDEAMHELGERDRQAILLRFFEGCSFAEVGAAIGLAENAARMRVDRALEKLRARLAQRGITSTAAALAMTLAHQPAVALPAGLSATISGASLAGTALRASGMVSTWAALDFMTRLKIASVAVMTVAAVASGTYLIAQQARDARPSPAPALSPAEFASLQAENQQLKAAIARLQATASAADASPLADLHVLVSAVQQKLIPPIGSLLRTKEGQLAPAVAALFKLTAQEKAALESSLGAMRQQLDILSAENVAAVEHPAPARVAIRIKPFVEEGGKVHDEFLAALRITLGPERYAALVTLIGPQFDRHAGSGFGATERSLTIERLPGGPPNSQKYTIFERVQPPPGSLQSFTSITSVDRAGLEQDFPALVRLLPEDF